MTPISHVTGLAGLLCLVLAGCSAVQPSSIVPHPTSARAEPAPPSSVAPGAIFRAQAYRPLFEDRRARAVGDVLTIVINEKAAADKTSQASASSSASLNNSASKLSLLPATVSDWLGLQAGGSNSASSKEAGTAGSNFLGTLAASVIEVLPNGNLLVSGEKQIGLDKGAEFIRFSGVVTPASISAGNMVPSTQVADARLEYRTNSQIDKAQLAGMLNRIFYSILPF